MVLVNDVDLDVTSRETAAAGLQDSAEPKVEDVIRIRLAVVLDVSDERSTVVPSTGKPCGLLVRPDPECR